MISCVVKRQTLAEHQRYKYRNEMHEEKIAAEVEDGTLINRTYERLGRSESMINSFFE